MTDKAVSALTSLTGATTATGDLLYIVDISEAAAADRSKKITAQELQNYLKAFPATIGVGGATPAASGAGISFPATASASSDANTLDDYEEGSWTPAIVMDSGTSTGGTFAGKYIKIGRLVTITIFADVGTVASTPVINGFSGLPFTSENTSALGVGSLRENASTGNQWHFRVGQNASTALVRRYDNDSVLTSSMTFVGTCSYFATA